MIIIGINAYHGDSSVCVLKDGKMVAASEEERFRRIKHWAGFPSESIRYCLKEAKVSLSQVGHIAVNRDPRANFWKKIKFSIINQSSFRLVLDRIRNASRWSSLEDALTEAFPNDHFQGNIHHVEHHLAHLSSAFLVSPFQQAVSVSVDGFGDFSSAAWGIGQGTDIRVDGRVYFPHSLGIYYMAMTQYLGFPHWGDEYKVMGLAPYGQPTFLKEMKEIVLLNGDGGYKLNMRFFKHSREKLERWPGCQPHVNELFSKELEELLGLPRKSTEELKKRHKDIASSVQAMYEESFFYLLNRLHQNYHVDNLTLAGGCAMNSVANGKIYKNTPFKKVYIQSAAGDAGGAIGAAFIVWHQVKKGPRNFVMDHAYWGPCFSEIEIQQAIRDKNEELNSQGCQVNLISQENDLCKLTAQAIADGKVVGWFQGRMEWGPRALGNRSIVCDPRRADMKDILNLKIKRRESFRPFAPSITRESVSEWFETDDDVPFMMQVFQIKEDKRSLIPAVTHVDGSGRLQTVQREVNPRYYNLIKSFQDLTGIPIVLNTSFNENEPVVCQPMEALNCFLRTRMDVLVLGNYYLSRAA